MKKIFNFFKNFFNKNIDKIKKIFIYMLIFLFGFGVGSCVDTNINKASAKAVSNSSHLIENGVLSFDFGEISQHTVVVGSPTVRHTSVSLPMCIDVNFSQGVGLVSYSLNVGYVNNYYEESSLSKLFSSYNLTWNTYDNHYLNNHVNEFSNIPITIKNQTRNFDTVQIHFYNGYVNDEYLQFGFYMPKSVEYSTVGTYGVLNAEKQTQGNTFFFFGTTDTVNDAESVIYYNRQIFDCSGLNAKFGEYSLTMPFFDLHTFVCNNGAIYSFGMSTLHRYPPNPLNYEYNYTYTFNSDDFDSAYDLGKQDGFDEGYAEGIKIGGATSTDEAYESGFKAGYGKGVNESLENVSPFTYIISTVDSFLNIKLFGSFTIGNIFAVVFGFLLFGVLLKVFLGG